MRHRRKRLQLNRFTSWRQATLKSLARNLLIQQSIKTTQARAKAARPLADKLISLAKANTLTAKRRAFQLLGDHKLVSLLFTEIGPRFSNKIGGYTRILNLGQRQGDNAKLAILELTEKKIKEAKKPKKDKEIETEKQPEAVSKEALTEEPRPKTEAAVKEKLPITKKPSKKFLGGLRNIFKKERDSL
ncbi:MAG: 50S ribosomal protein L17 [Candidatus Omnitrophica bacterium]|nr:50S ribosomal protein L17 [Candidatus Omnitrophota bacterium]